MRFQELFDQSLTKYFGDARRRNNLWSEIELAYSSSKRHYHTLAHLENLAHELRPHRDLFKNWDNVVFAIAYHDIVYDVLKKDNEEKSADVAVNKLTGINFQPDALEHCRQLILATKGHEATNEIDINLFVDADLSILGAEPSLYQLYSAQIRQEYSVYPDLLYNPGRKKVLEHFLKMPRIYKTELFAKRYEDKARVNLEEELRRLATC